MSQTWPNLINSKTANLKHSLKLLFSEFWSSYSLVFESSASSPIENAWLQLGQESMLKRNSRLVTSNSQIEIATHGCSRDSHVPN